MPAELRLKYIREKEDRGLKLNAGEPARLRQVVQQAKKALSIAAIRCERNDCQDAQRWIENGPEAPDRDLFACWLHLSRDGAVQSADCPIKIPEETNAGHAIAHAPFALVARIETNTEEQGSAIAGDVAARPGGIAGLHRRAWNRRPFDLKQPRSLTSPRLGLNALLGRGMSAGVTSARSRKHGSSWHAATDGLVARRRMPRHTL